MYHLTADYHTHSTMSDGKSTMEENVLSALGSGLAEIGLTDHAPGHLLYGVRDIHAYLTEINRLKEKYAGQIKIRAGIECNLTGLAGEIDMPRGKESAFDLLIVGFHKGARSADFASFWSYYVRRTFSHNGPRIRAQATDAYIALLAKGGVDILAHPGYAIGVDIAAVAEACRLAGTLFELNVRHKEINAAFIECAAKTGVKFVISSDAHRAEKIARAENVLQKALAAGLSEKEIVNIKKE